MSIGYCNAQNTVDHMISGHAYARALRGHFLVCAALNRFDTMSINTIAFLSLPDDLHTRMYKYFHRMYIFTCYM